MPYGFGSTVDAEGTTRGVMAAAAIVFFAFYGFDAVATSAEEAKNPGRDLTIGIIGSMAVCTLIYMLVALAAVGAVDYRLLADSAEPLALVLRTLDQPFAAWAVALAALVALPSVILVMMYGQSRIFFVMARDGLLPRAFAKVSPAQRHADPDDRRDRRRRRGRRRLLPAQRDRRARQCRHAAAFIAVGACMMVLRRTRPDLPRVFRCPAPYVVGTLTILGCLYLIASLPVGTLIRFLIWNAIGLAVYFAYSRSRSLAAQNHPVTGI